MDDSNIDLQQSGHRGALPRVTLVRHGETEWSRMGRHTGRTDVELTPTGREEARVLGGMARGQHFDAVFTSPLSRARQTCELAGLGEQAELCDDLREWDYGAYEGRTTAEIRETEPGWTVWSHIIHDGESLHDVAQRCDRVIEAVTRYEGDVALFAHAHVLRILGARWCGLHPLVGRSLSLATASTCTLGAEREIPVIAAWNQPWHLRLTAPL